MTGLASGRIAPGRTGAGRADAGPAGTRLAITRGAGARRAESRRVETSRTETRHVEAAPAPTRRAQTTPARALRESAAMAAVVPAAAGFSLPWWGCALVALGLAIVCAWGWCRGRRDRSRRRLAERADRNGQALLALADELEHYLREQRRCGQPTRRQQHWPRLCRSLAMDHLECINRLMLEPCADESVAQDRRSKWRQGG